MPGWEDLWEMAAGQDGLFQTRDAAEHGISRQALHLSSQIEPVEHFRGVYRFKRAPIGRWHLYHAAFVWSRGEGVISHGSALQVWGLSDWLPRHAEMTLPPAWKNQRMIPATVLPFYADLPEQDVQWHESFRVTTARRSVDDFIVWGIRPDLARQAIEQATSRGRPGGALFHRRQLANRHLLVK
jgi:predicted transcriptional regulator of viral defense system